MSHAVLATVATLLLMSSVPAAPAVPVEAPPPSGALVWYLGHCGYAVRTSNHLLIFDYQERRDGPQEKVRPARPSLDAGWIDPEEIKDLKVLVFASHSHDDHFDPVIFSWAKQVKDISYFFGWREGADPRSHSLAGPRAEYKTGDFEIATINSHHSGVPEVAWLVKVDGLVIYHNGDCLPDDPAGEYDFLRTKAASVDLAFVFPLIENSEEYGLQNRAFFEKFRPRAVFPMHVQAGGKRYLDFQKAFVAGFPGLSLGVPMRLGQRCVLDRTGISD